jgi:uncharacterized repeat protein (TIGR01451 family)
LANNTQAFNNTVTGSYDPNDKTVRTSSGLSDTQYFPTDDQWVDYTIRFQNTGTDTAFQVAVVDTIDVDLDLSTLEILVASHAFTPSFDADRVLRFSFDDIMLPDSSVNEAASHGLISFRLRPIAGIAAGTEIHNAADLYFDFNPPVHTNDADLMVETGTSVQAQAKEAVRVFPNPVRDLLHIESAAEVSRLEIFSVDGRSVLTASTVVNTLNVSELTRGVYVLLIRTSDGASFTQRFTKL